MSISKSESELMRDAYRLLVGRMISDSMRDSVEWFASSIPRNFDFNSMYNGNHLIGIAVARQKHITVRWLILNGADASEAIKYVREKKMSRVLKESSMEKTFISTIVVGLYSRFASSSEFAVFLAGELSDARMLMQIAQFMYSEEVPRKRKAESE